MDLQALTKPRGPHLRNPSILDLIDAEGDCWEWGGTIATTGYAVTHIDNRQHYVHRLMWQTLVGAIPKGRQVDHLCRNRGCVNPSHMEIVTRVENVMRGYSPFAKRARKTKCKHGHWLAGSNLLHDKAGHRGCRQCRNDRALAAYHRNKENE